MKNFPCFLLVLLSPFAFAADIPAVDAAAAPARIAELRREIARHDALYHQQSTSEISDVEYDRLKRQLGELERRFPEAAKQSPAPAAIGDDRSGLFQTRRHRERMTSLDKVYTEAEVRGFLARVVKAAGDASPAFVVEPKFDGIAVSVTFEQGRLVRAVTRGNGIEGDDVTANVLQIRNLPRELRETPGCAWPDLIELRGEIYEPWSEFARVNEERELAGETRFANPRNLAAGTIRQLDAREVARRGLQVVFYGVGECVPETARPASQRGLHGLIAAWGLPGVTESERFTAAGADEITQALDVMNRMRAGFDFPTDGAVVKLDSFALQRELGSTETAPRWAIAYKFAPPRVETQVRAITLQVGRTGMLTPVAELAPVKLSGSTITRATLHNREEIARRDIRVGDYVYVEKAGEIIPAITGVNLERRPASTRAFEFPDQCPECHATLARNESEVAIRCPNPACPAQLRRRLEHFASKACLDIEGLGPAMIDSLVANGWVKDLPDLYRLRRADLLTLGKNNAKSMDRLLAAIEKSKRAELWRIVHGLGIPQVGAMAAKDLARQCGDLSGVLEKGPSAVAVLGELRYQKLIADLIAVGVGASSTTSEGPPAAASKLAGKTFVLTGTLPSLTRAQATAKIEAAGGKVANAVSRTTQFVVVGAEPGAKLEQARKLGIPTIDEPTLLRMIEE